MLVYSYDRETSVFLESREARESPLEPGVFLIPAFATDTSPPALAANETAKWENGSWSIIPDYRGEVWYEAYGKPVTVTSVGDPSTFDPVLYQVEPTPPAATIEDVANERDRRLALGFDYDFQDSRGVHHIGTTERDMKNWAEVTDAANAFINIGMPNQTIYISTDTGGVTITALEWQSILVAATIHRQTLFTASFVLQAMDPIPDIIEITDNSHWT